MYVMKSYGAYGIRKLKKAVVAIPSASHRGAKVGNP